MQISFHKMGRDAIFTVHWFASSIFGAKMNICLLLSFRAQETRNNYEMLSCGLNLGLSRQQLLCARKQLSMRTQTATQAPHTLTHTSPRDQLRRGCIPQPRAAIFLFSSFLFLPRFSLFALIFARKRISHSLCCRSSRFN